MMNKLNMQDHRMVLGTGLAMLVATIVLAPMVQNNRSFARVSFPELAIQKTVQVPEAARPVAEKAKPKPVVVLNDADHLSLRSMFKEYTFTFTGTTTCEGQPCSARMEVLIEPDGAEPVWITVNSEPNGRYWFEVPFQAKSRQQLDWMLTLRDERDRRLQSGGRQILMDERGQTFARDFDIR